ncbi:MULTISPECIES: hypothetical protein [Niastella]|uniref:RES domain-containing protein n=1 Tax=Niastella soli TaxID=2821487 RepID=A0ABS3Z2H4_9BACT|nr:hypothetical protein [Niastella soli]MBO9203875.1 hypothetical protein [Niastella soli]
MNRLRINDSLHNLKNKNGSSYLFRDSGVNQDNDIKLVYSSSDPCDGLALMLFNKTENYRTLQKLSEILTADEMQAIKCTYGEKSMSVSEGYENFEPEYDSPAKLQTIVDKIKRFYIKKIRLDKTLDDDTFTEVLFDISTLSELFSALDIAKEQGLQVALTLDDF